MSKDKNELKVKNFHCSEHGFIKPKPYCPKCDAPYCPRCDMTPQDTQKDWREELASELFDRVWDFRNEEITAEIIKGEILATIKSIERKGTEVGKAIGREEGLDNMGQSKTPKGQKTKEE